MRCGEDSGGPRAATVAALALAGPTGAIRGKAYFEVLGGDTGNRYRIYAGAATNVCEIDENGRPKIGLCFLPLGDLPIGDVMLAQKIALETSEGSALAVARKFSPGGFLFSRSRPLR
jgi:hypothetical protein